MTEHTDPQPKLPIVPPSIGHLLILTALLVLIAGCSSTSVRDNGLKDSADFANAPDAVPKLLPRSRFGNPDTYVVFGKRYHTLDSSTGYVARGIASWYGPKFHGRRTSSGEPYDMYAMTAAHKSLPLPTFARVTNLQNGRTAVVKVNDRGPFHGDRVIDLSYAAAAKLGIVASGTAPVEVRAIDPARPPREENQFLAGDEAAGESPARDSDAGPLTPAIAAGSMHPRAGKGGDAEPSAPPLAAAGRGARAPATVAEPEPEVERDRGRARVAAKVAAAPASDLKAQPAVAAAPAKAGGKDDLYLQVGAFGERSNAEHLRRRLVEHLAEHVLVRASDGSRAPLYRVHIGPLHSRQEATTVSHRLAGLGLTQSRIVTE